MNQSVKDTGVGDITDLRATDLTVDAAAHRYRVFKEKTWDALQSLQEIYHYHFVSAEGPIEEVEQNIVRELEYQSSLELDPKTYDRMRYLPLAQDITLHARQELVRRLDRYEIEQKDLFRRVIDVIKNKFMEIIQRHSLSGKAVVNSEDTMFAEPNAIPILIDIFSERGFHAVVDKKIADIPDHIDLENGKITCRQKTIYQIEITFKGSEIRRG